MQGQNGLGPSGSADIRFLNIPEINRVVPDTIRFGDGPDPDAVSTTVYIYDTVTIENATAEENAEFDAFHDSMRGGWTGTRDLMPPSGPTFKERWAQHDAALAFAEKLAKAKEANDARLRSVAGATR